MILLSLCYNQLNKIIFYLEEKMNTLIPVSSKIFEGNVPLQFSNILDGLTNYLNFNINGNNVLDGENAIIEFLTEVFQLNDNEGFVDLYLNKLDESEKNNLLKMCYTDDTNTIIEHINLNHNEPYYKLTNKSLIPFLVRLNTREIFFVTFYFSKIPFTIWGNFNMTFPCFSDNEENSNYYKKLAKNHNL